MNLRFRIWEGLNISLIELAYPRMGIFCPNANILSNLFKEMGMLGCKPMDNPIERNHKFKDCYEEPETD